MPVNKDAYKELIRELGSNKVVLVAVSKTRPSSDIRELYDLGHRDFGENYVQELVEKQAELPGDIRWHYVGHLQTNKVKQIIPFVWLIQGVDSRKLLQEIDRQAARQDRIVDCLLQVHIAEETTKFGMDEEELGEVMKELPGLKNIRVLGLMGMASFTDDREKVESEFRYLDSLYKKHPELSVLSIGMSHDYKMAVENGSNMVRIGTLIFGEREK